jgi:hypothetical protein
LDADGDDMATLADLLAVVHAIREEAGSPTSIQARDAVFAQLW